VQIWRDYIGVLLQKEISTTTKRQRNGEFSVSGDWTRGFLRCFRLSFCLQGAASQKSSGSESRLRCVGRVVRRQTVAAVPVQTPVVEQWSIPPERDVLRCLRATPCRAGRGLGNFRVRRCERASRLGTAPRSPAGAVICRTRWESLLEWIPASRRPRSEYLRSRRVNRVGRRQSAHLRAIDICRHDKCWAASHGSRSHRLRTGACTTRRRFS
jgi:hypothetical protein